jgi:hypothetical protein
VLVTVTLAAVYFGLPGPLAVPAVAIAALLALRAFVARAKVRRWLSSAAGALTTWVTLITISFGVPHVSLSSHSPDGAIAAELYEADRFFDRNFRVRLTRYWAGIVPIRRVVYASPDEGARGCEQLIWSKDGRHVLLIGPRFFGTQNACLSSGDVLYLLVDVQTGAVASNASQVTGYARRECEFFNVVLGKRFTGGEEIDLLAFLRAL